MKQRWIALLLLLVMAVSLAGCGGGDDTPAQGGGDDAVTDQGGGDDAAEETGEATAPETPLEVKYTGDGTLMADVPYQPHPILGDGGAPDNSRHATGSFAVTKGGTTFLIPDYYGELESKQGDDNRNASVTSYYAGTGAELGMISLAGFDASEAKLKDYDLYDAHSVLFSYKEDDLLSMENLTNLHGDEVKMLLLNNGWFAVSKRYTYNLAGVDCEHYLTAINNPRAKTLMYVELIQASGAEYDYTADYEQVVLTADVAKE